MHPSLSDIGWLALRLYPCVLITRFYVVEHGWDSLVQPLLIGVMWSGVLSYAASLMAARRQRGPSNGS